jgi:mono/diheme cytochrome c family protein
MKKIMKWTGIVLGGLTALMVLATVVLYFTGTGELTQTYPGVAVETIDIPNDAEAVVRGRHVATIWGCTKCHGSDLSSVVYANDPIEGSIPLLGMLTASNLTSGTGGVGKSYTDTDWVRAIRHGIKPDQHVEAFMFDYSTMSDRDLGDLIAYLKQAPAIDSVLPDTNYGPVYPVASAAGLFAPVAGQIDHSALHPAQTTPGATKEYGQYLAAVCAGCHGKSIVAQLKDWTQKDFVRAMQTTV